MSKRIKIFLALTFSLAALCSHGQASLSQKHINKIEKQQKPSRKLTLYKKFFRRDSIRYARGQEKRWQTQSDSIFNGIKQRQHAVKNKSKKVKDGVNTRIYNTVYRPWAMNQVKKQLHWLASHNIYLTLRTETLLRNYFLHYFLDATQNDSTLAALKESMPGVDLPKSLADKAHNYAILKKHHLNNNALSGVKENLTQQESFRRAIAMKGEASRYTNEVRQYQQQAEGVLNGSAKEQLLEKGNSEMKNLAGSKLGGISELNSAQDEFNKIKDLPGQYQESIQNLQDSAYLASQAKQKAEQLALEYVAANPQILQPMQAKMALLMKKYSMVPNSNDLTTAIKRTSLADRTFKERLFFAGNFQVLTFQPFAVDFSPVIGYRFNSRLTTGAGLNYRKTFIDSLPVISPDVFGYKGFSSFDIASNFFLHAEFERNSPGMEKAESYTKRIWKNAAFAGVGRRFTLHRKLEMTTVFLYNFLYNHPDPVYPRRWVVRFGFQTSELAFFKPRKNFK